MDSFGCCRAAFTATFGVGQVHQAVLVEGRRKHDIEQAALPLRPDFGDATQRRADPPFGTDHPQVALPFGDQNPLGARQERQRPWVLETLGQGVDLDGAVLAGKGPFGRGLGAKWQEDSGAQGEQPGT